MKAIPCLFLGTADVTLNMFINTEQTLTGRVGTRGSVLSGPADWILRHLKRYQYILPHNKAPVCVSPQFPDCEALEEGNGHRISCLIEHKDNLTGSGCKQFLTKMASIVFGDYRLIYKFMDQCNADITKLQCGRLETEDDSVSNNNND